MEETKNIRLQVEYVNVEDLKPYYRNTKLHPAKQLRELRDQIKRFGFHEPLFIDRDNVIINGHGRLTVCKELGYKELPCIRLSNKFNLTPEEMIALRIGINKVAQTGFDEDTMSLELPLLPLELVKLIGFDEADVDPIHAEMRKIDNSNCEYPLVAKYSEKYSGFIIVTENEIDETFLINALEIETEKSYKTKTVGRSFVIPFEKFKKLWEKNKGIAKK